MIDRLNYHRASQRAGIALLALFACALALSPRQADAGTHRMMSFTAIAGQRADQGVVVVSGTVKLDFNIDIPNTGTVPGGNEGVRYRVTLDDQPVGGELTAFPNSIQWDTTAAADGAHFLSFHIINNSSGFEYTPFPLVVIVDNVPGAAAGPQDIPVCPKWRSMAGLISGGDAPRCDWVGYPGSPPAPRGHPQPVVKGIPFQTPLPGFELYGENIMPLVDLFSASHRFLQTSGGHPIARSFEGNAGQYYSAASHYLDRLPLLDGPRNVGWVSAYVTGAVHPVSEAFVFAEIGDQWGRIGKVDLDGTITTIAGYRTKAGILPYDPHDSAIPEHVRASQHELVGVFVDGPQGFRSPSDVVVDPRNSDILFATDAKNHRIVRIDTSLSPARVTTYAGSLTGEKGLRNGAGTQALFHEPFSLTAAPDGTLFVADRDNSVIRRIDPARNVTTLVGQGYRNIPKESDMRNANAADNRNAHMVNGPFSTASIIYPMVVRLDSKGNIIVGEENLGTIRRVNMATRTVELVAVAPATSPWIWLDVDTEGTFGPKDDIFYITVLSSEAVWRISPDGSRVDRMDQGSYNFESRMNMRRYGHYGWLVAVGKGALWTNGFGTDGLIRIRKALPGDRIDKHDEEIYTHYNNGRTLWHHGTVYGFPWGTRPSFALLHGHYGWNQLGTSPNFDDLAHLSDGELARLIQSGWGSGVARPEITGNDLSDVIFFIRRHSLPSVRSGVRPGPDHPDKAAPIISNVKTEEAGPSAVKVSWTTNEPAIGAVQFGAARLYSRWSEIEGGFSSRHSVFLAEVAPGTAQHYLVIAKDEAGNIAKTADATFTLSGSAPPPQESISCADGTQNNQCSQTKPKFCSSGALADKASQCGCPAGQTAQGDSCVTQTTQPPPPSLTVHTNQTLVNLADNTWVKANPDPSKRYFPVYGDPATTEALTEADKCKQHVGDKVYNFTHQCNEPQGRTYTSPVYGSGKVWYFGGAHGSYPGNDVEMYDIASNMWMQSYRPNVPPLSDPVYGSGGSEQVWVDPVTGEWRPYQIHGYGRTSFHEGLGWYAATATYCKRTAKNSTTGAWECAEKAYGLIGYNSTTKKWESLVHSWPIGWGENLTDWDPVLGGLIAYTGRSVYLIKDRTITERKSSPHLLGDAGIGGSPSVYIPELQSHLIAVMPQGGGSEPKLYLYHSVNETFREMAIPAKIKGLIGGDGNFAMAYDTGNQRVIVAQTENNVVRTWVYDILKDQQSSAVSNWTQLPESSMAPRNYTLSVVNREPLHYDPLSHVFILVLPREFHQAGYPGFVETWAYRYKKAGGSAESPQETGAKISLVKAADKAQAAPGDEVTFTLTIANNGAAAVTNLAITDPLDSLLAYISNSASDGGTYQAANSSVGWTFASLPAHTTKTVSFRAKVLDPNPAPALPQSPPPGNLINADPTNYRDKLGNLKPGDTLVLAAGTYTQGLPIQNVNGTAERPITITGPSSGAKAVILGRDCCNTVQIDRASYVTIRNLDIDGDGKAGDGVKSSSIAHHITLENLYIHGNLADQQVVGISTKAPAWDWVIRNNTIEGLGTGIYLGNSDGNGQFVRGLIEYNLITDTIGYNMQIKHQNPRPATLVGMPAGDSKTIIRHNVFSKAHNASTGSNARPNLLVGHWPLSGAGQNDTYEIYGNFFYQNPSGEPLFQGEGAIALYNNLFYNSLGDAVWIQPHHDVPKMIRVFHNTIVASGAGVSVSGGDANDTQEVIGNAVFAASPLSGGAQRDNITDTYANAGNYAVNPAGALGALDLFPKAGKLAGSVIASSSFNTFTDWNKDFNGATHTGAFRGAYTQEGINPGWKPQLAIKPAAGSAQPATLPPPQPRPPVSGQVSPALSPDPSVVSLVEGLGDNRGAWLPEFKTAGSGLDAYPGFDTAGPGIRDYSRKWVYAQSRGRALYAGGNHGAPHKFNDVWEYDLPSNTWAILHRPDAGVTTPHTWWGLTYDQHAEKLYWMSSAAPGGAGNWSLDGYVGPPFRSYDPYAQNGWGVVRAPAPHPIAIQGGALEYIPGRNLTIWYGAEWNGNGMWAYDAKANAWKQLLALDDTYFNKNAPPAEAVMNYDRVNDVVVAARDDKIYTYAFDTNKWGVAIASAPFTDAHDARSSFAYDPVHDIHLLRTGGKLYAYHYKTNTIETLNPSGMPAGDSGMMYYDEAQNVFVFYFNNSAKNWVYRYKKSPAQKSPLPPSGAMNFYQAIPDHTWVSVAPFTSYEDQVAGKVPSERIMAYSGMAVDTMHQKVLLFGGGHNDYWGNEVWALDIPTRAWKRMYAPDDLYSIGLDVCRQSVDNQHFPGKWLPSGRPISRHTYDSVEFIAQKGVMIAGAGSTYSGPNRKGVSFWNDTGEGGAGGCYPNSPRDTWVYNLATNQWTYQGSAYQSDPAKRTLAWSPGTLAYDTDTGLVFSVDGVDYSRTETWAYDVAANAWTQKSPAASPPWDYHRTAAYDSARKRVYLYGGDGAPRNELWAYHVPSNTWTQMNPQRALPAPGGGAGLAYDSANDVLLILAHGALYVYDPRTNQMTKNPGGKAVPEQESNAVFGRFHYDPVNNVTFLVNGGSRTGINVWAYRYKKSSTTQSSSAPVRMAALPSHITNTASLTYRDASGKSYPAVTSNTVTVGIGQTSSQPPPDSAPATGGRIEEVLARERSLTKIINPFLVNRLKGKILLQVEERGEAWYVDPKAGKRFYLKDGTAAYTALRKFGIGITNKDLLRLPLGSPDQPSIAPRAVSAFCKRTEGTIYLQVESRGEAWYIHHCKRYYLKDGDVAYQIMRKLSLGITNENLRKVGVE